MSSEQLPGPQYHTSPLPSGASQSQQLPPISTPQSNAPPHSTPETPHLPPTPLPIQEVSSSTPEPNRKRARPTVSCFECRRKKLRCDRVQPCSQCVKGRREDLCQFATEVTNVGVGRARPQPTIAAREDDGERAGKRMRIEDVMTPNSTPGNGRVDETNRKDVSAPGSTLGRIYVKGNRSRYLGLGDRMAMLDHFEDAKSYIMNSFKDPDTVGMMFELTGYQNSFQRKPKKPQVEIPHDRTALVTEMLKALPNNASLDLAFHLHETHWEGLTRVLHMPTVLEEVHAVAKFLHSQRPGADYSLPQNIRESVIPQILGVYVLSARLSKMMKQSVSEDQIAIWMEMMQRWLELLKGKEKLNIQTLRVQILLFLSKMNNLAQTTDLWRESGTLARSAMIMGLHQDPERYEVFSLFEKEQRRKLWRTVVELDMQFSLVGGMPVAIRSSNFLSRSLGNVDDFALKENMTAYPESQSERLWTDALPQIILSAFIKERLDATNLLAGNINMAEDAEKLLSLARYFEHSLQSLPTPSRANYSWGELNQRNSGRLFTKIMLDVQLRRPTLSIYQHIMLSEQSGLYPMARNGALSNAIAMLSHLDALDPELADPNTIKSHDQLNLFHVLCKKDIIQAALILCLEIRSLSLAYQDGEGQANGIRSPHDDLLPWTKTSLTRIVENTLNSLLQRLGEFGSDLKDILPLSIVLQSARSDGSPDDKKALMKKGAERVLKACREAPIPATPATSQEGTTPITNMQQAGNMHPRPLPYESNDYRLHNLQYTPLGTGNGFGDLNMLPGNNLTFQDFDFGFGDWDTRGSWF